MSWMAGLSAIWNQVLSSLFGLASKGIDYYIARANGNVQEAIALMAADQARIAAHRDITLAGMSHPVWWIAWALFVIPTGIYYSKILIWDKTLGLGSTDALTGFVLDWSGYIVTSIFCLQVGTGIIGALLSRLMGGKK